MTYEVYINKKAYKVSRKVFICHCTRKIRTLQPESFYNNFILNYRIKDFNEAEEFMKMYLDSAFGSYKFRMIRPLVGISFDSVLSMANLADAIKKHTSVYLYKTDTTYFLNQLINTRYNYPELEFSPEYNLLTPWISFYHSLIYKIEDDLPKKRTVIYPKDINTVIKDLGFDFTYTEIREDILKHMALLEQDGKLYWADKLFSRWLWKTPSIMINVCNYFKRISRI